MFFFFKQKTAYEMRISDWSSDVCSSDLGDAEKRQYEEQPEELHQRRGAAEDLDIGHRQPAHRQRAVELGEGGDDGEEDRDECEIGRASCRERVCQDG